MRAKRRAKMPVAAAPIVPARANRLVLDTATGEAERDAHAGGQGASSASNSGAMPVAIRFGQLAFVLFHYLLPPNRPCLVARAGREGATEICRSGAGAAARATARLIPVAGKGGRCPQFAS